MAIVNTSLTRNASAYWDLELWAGPFDKPSPTSEFLPWSTVAGGISRSILNKVTEIRFKEVFNAQDYQVKGNAMDPFSSVVIRFEGLTKDEASNKIFGMGIGFSLYAGWYSFYSGKEVNDTVFNGVIYKLDTEYDKNGIKLMMHLINPGIVLLYSPLPTWDELGVGLNSFSNASVVLLGLTPKKRPVFKDVMTAICDYCAMGGILKITRNKKLATYLTSEYEFDGFIGTNYPTFAPHLNIPKRISESQGRGDRAINAADVFSWFAHNYGLVWNVRNNEIYLGEMDLTSPLGFKKLFNYRGEQDANFIQTSHLSNDPFETVRTTMVEGQNYAVTSNTFYDSGARMLDAATHEYIEKNWRDKKQDSALLKAQKLQQSFMNPQMAVAIGVIQNMAYKNQAGVMDHISALKMRKTPVNSKDERNVMNRELAQMRKMEPAKAAAITAEYKAVVEAALKEVDLRYVYGSVLCQIKGALADFNYQAGDRFSFYYKEGEEVHGVYLSDFVEYYYTKGSCWKMDISGRKPNTDDPTYDTKHIKIIDTIAGMRTVTLGTQIWMVLPDGGWKTWGEAAESTNAFDAANKHRLIYTLYYQSNIAYKSGSLSGIGVPNQRVQRV